MRRDTCIMFFLFAGLLLPASVRGQLVPEFQPPKANCCLPFAAQSLADQLQDWNQIGRYHEDDVRLQTQRVEKGRVVFLGDSITDGWKLAVFSWQAIREPWYWRADHSADAGTVPS